MLKTLFLDAYYSARTSFLTKTPPSDSWVGAKDHFAGRFRNNFDALAKKLSKDRRVRTRYDAEKGRVELYDVGWDVIAYVKVRGTLSTAVEAVVITRVELAAADRACFIKELHTLQVNFVVRADA